MARRKQEVKAKLPVRIRFKKLANGNKSIYLDTYRGKDEKGKIIAGSVGRYGAGQEHASQEG